MRNVVLPAENAVLDGDGSVATRVAARSLARRQEQYRDEVHRLIEAALSLIRDTGEIDPRVSEIVARAGLSNQAFYRHFRSKDELLVAVLDEGVRRLLRTIERRMARARSPQAGVQRWVEAILAQARNRAAAEATRPFVLNNLRLAHRFPEQTRRTLRLLQAPLRAAITAGREAGAMASADPDRDADAIYHVAMGMMQAHVTAGTVPSRADVERVVAFALRGLGAG